MTEVPEMRSAAAQVLSLHDTNSINWHVTSWQLCNIMSSQMCYDRLASDRGNDTSDSDIGAPEFRTMLSVAGGSWLQAGTGWFAHGVQAT